MGEGIITKKRKIRAIHEALETEAIKQSDYYNDILKYLEIYEDYCDLVIKNRKERKTRLGHLDAPTPDPATEKKMEEEQMDVCSLLDSLKNERELKFITLNLLTEEEDPKEELILKIPQYVTKVEPRPRHKKMVNDRGSVDSNRSNSSSVGRRKECGVLQKDLGATVTV